MYDETRTLKVTTSILLFTGTKLATGQNADILSTAGKCPEKGSRFVDSLFGMSPICRSPVSPRFVNMVSFGCGASSPLLQIVLVCMITEIIRIRIVVAETLEIFRSSKDTFFHSCIQTTVTRIHLMKALSIHQNESFSLIFQDTTSYLFLEFI